MERHKMPNDAIEAATAAKMAERIQALERELAGVRGFRASQKEHELEAMRRYIEKITKDKSSAVGFLASAGIIDANGELAEQFRSAAPPPIDAMRTGEPKE